MKKFNKAFLSVLYLLVYSSFSAAELNPALVTQVEKGVDTSVQLLQCLDSLGKWASEAKEDAKVIRKVLAIFDGVAKFAAGLSFAGALVSFIFAFIPKENPTLEFMKVQFSEVNRKLDSIAVQLSTLAQEMEWAAYASVYSRDENNIKNAWVKLRELIDSAAQAETEEEKTRLAERFTSFYESTGTESSVYNFHRYLTESNPASLNKNLLVLVTDKSRGNFKTLVVFTSYFVSLMVTGLQLNLLHYALKGYSSTQRATEAVTQLTNVRANIQAVLIDCADNFESWAAEDVQIIGTQKFADSVHLAYSVKKHLDEKFNWYEWTVIVHDRDAEFRTYGNSITAIAQDKFTIHLLHREKGFSVNEDIEAKMLSEWNKKGMLCHGRKAGWPLIFEDQCMMHVEYIHENPNYVQTVDNKLVKLKCPNHVKYPPGMYHPIYYDYTTVTVYLKSQELLENDPCNGVNCNKGECRRIKDTSTGICKCEKMFYGPTCEGSVQNDIDYAVMETKIIGISDHPVPDLTTIYYDLKEMKRYAEDVVRTLRQDIQWTQILIEYGDVLQKFRYLKKCHSSLQNETMSQDQFVSEVKALFTESNSFLFMLYKFDQMMQGTGPGDRSNILDFLRKSMLRRPLNQDDQSQLYFTTACSKSYSERVDYIVRILFAMEMEAVLGWLRFRLLTRQADSPKDTLLDLFSPTGATQVTEKNRDVDPTHDFKEYVAQQWSLFNRNGCGPLKAEGLSNAYCEKLYHSTDQLEVPLLCQNDYQAFPNAVQCAKGKWSALPVCYTHPQRGYTTCSSEDGATVCTASCSAGWAFTDGQTSSSYRCTQPPCGSFSPQACDVCTANFACGGSQVCAAGRCVEGCDLYRCGVNAQCLTTYHTQHCECVSPWVPWEGEDPQTAGCRNQPVQWLDSSPTAPVPASMITFYMQLFL